jgi:hypothetical protein
VEEEGDGEEDSVEVGVVLGLAEDACAFGAAAGERGRGRRKKRMSSSSLSCVPYDLVC